MSKPSTNDSNGNNAARVDSRKMSSGKLIAIISAVLGVVIIAALVVIIVILLGDKNKPAVAVTGPTGGRGTIVTLENVDAIREELSKPVEDGYYETRMNVDWVFDTAKTPSKNAYVENPTSNTRTVYFDLSLADTGELVYSSPYIPVGGKLTDFALDTDLDAGDYSAIVTYHLVDDDNNELTTVSVSVKLQIRA